MIDAKVGARWAGLHFTAAGAVMRDANGDPETHAGSGRALRLRKRTLRDRLVAAGFYRQHLEQL